jgi:hypothetical protein
LSEAGVLARPGPASGLWDPGHGGLGWGRYGGEGLPPLTYSSGPVCPTR